MQAIPAAVARGLVSALAVCGGAGAGKGSSEAPTIPFSTTAVTFAATQAGGAVPDAQVLTIPNAVPLLADTQRGLR